MNRWRIAFLISLAVVTVAGEITLWRWFDRQEDALVEVLAAAMIDQRADWDPDWIEAGE